MLSMVSIVEPDFPFKAFLKLLRVAKDALLHDLMGFCLIESMVMSFD